MLAVSFLGHTMRFKNYIFVLTLLLSKLVSGQSNIVGYYKSNFAIAGYTATQIDFKNDFTFIYEMYGHLSYDKSKGTYKTIGDTVILTFEPDTTTNLSASSRPTKFFIKNNRLLLLENNDIVHKQWGYKDKLFGKRRLKQLNYYLQRHDDKIFEYWKNY
jgi:hypothetical protein